MNKKLSEIEPRKHKKVNCNTSQVSARYSDFYSPKGSNTMPIPDGDGWDFLSQTNNSDAGSPLPPRDRAKTLIERHKTINPGYGPDPSFFSQVTSPRYMNPTINYKGS